MTTPEPGEKPPPVPAVHPTRLPVSPANRGGGRGPLEWARAIALGIRDTAHDMLDEGRKGAHDAYEEGWRRYDAKTKHRRRK